MSELVLKKVLWNEFVGLDRFKPITNIGYGRGRDGRHPNDVHLNRPGRQLLWSVGADIPERFSHTARRTVVTIPSVSPESGALSSINLRKEVFVRSSTMVI